MFVLGKVQKLSHFVKDDICPKEQHASLWTREGSRHCLSVTHRTQGWNGSAPCIFKPKWVTLSIVSKHLKWRFKGMCVFFIPRGKGHISASDVYFVLCRPNVYLRCIIAQPFGQTGNCYAHYIVILMSIQLLQWKYMNQTNWEESQCDVYTWNWPQRTKCITNRLSPVPAPAKQLDQLFRCASISRTYSGRWVGGW